MISSTSLWVLPIELRVYLIFLSIIIGLVFGSFGNAWAYRIVHNEKIARGRSHCPKCGHVLSALDLVPLFSYLFLKGKCRYCKEKISPRYPAAEGIMAVVFALILIKFGLGIQTLLWCGFGFCLVVLSLVDWESLIIPDRLIVLSAVFAAICRALSGEILSALIGAFVLSGGLLIIVLIADRILKKDTMGGGDIKLTFSIGMALGVGRGLFAIFISCIIGLLLALLPGAKGREGEDAKAFPFGPALCMGAVIALLIGDYFITWYSGFLYI